MAWTQTDIDSIDSAIKSGVLEVRYADRTVVYRSMNELLQARQLAVVEVNKANGTMPTRQYRIYTDKGF